MSFFGMSNQYDFVSNGRVVYKGTQFTEYEAVEEDTPEPKNFSQLWAHVEAGIPLFVLGCATAYVEDNGFNPPSNESDWDSNWFCFGKALGHAIALAQATGEILQGLSLIGSGIGGGAILAVPSGGTSVVVGGTLVTVGAVEVTHGSLVFGNAGKNVFDDSMFFSVRGGTSGTDGGGSKGNNGRGSSGKKRVYKPSPKHDPKSGWGSPNPLPNDKVGQKLLDSAYSSNKNKQLYNYYEGKIVKFQPDDVAGGWHPYKVENSAKEVPADVLRKMLDDGTITKVEYGKFRKNL